MTLDELDFDKLEHLGSGTYGSVYHLNNDAIKKYHPSVPGVFGYLSSNPCLRFYKKRVKRLIARRKKVKYTDLIHDELYINNAFKGVIGTYHKGVNLRDIKNLSLEEKISIGHQLVRNAEELTRHRIYHLDFKPNNIMYTTNKEVKIIDLDDCFTKVRIFPSFFLKRRSKYSLKKALIAFFDESTHYSLDDQVLNELPIYQKGYPFYVQKKVSYRALHRYLEERRTPYEYAILTPNELTNPILEELKTFLNPSLKVILYYDKAHTYIDGQYLKDLTILKNLNISVYDIICQKNHNTDPLSEYLNSHYTKGYYRYEDNTFKYHYIDNPKVYIKA